MGKDLRLCCRMKGGNNCGDANDLCMKGGDDCGDTVDLGMKGENDGGDVSVPWEVSGISVGAVSASGDCDSGKRGCVDCEVFRTSVISSINKLREDVSNLKESVRKRGEDVPSCRDRISCYCWLYVGIGDKEFVAGKVQLENILGCQVIQYICLEGSYVWSRTS